MSGPIYLKKPVNEGATLILTRMILDHDLLPLAPPALTTLVWTLYDRESDTIINNHDHVDGLADVSAEGLFTLELEPDDQKMIGDGAGELHMVTIEWTYEGGDREGNGELVFMLRRVRKITPI